MISQFVYDLDQTNSEIEFDRAPVLLFWKRERDRERERETERQRDRERQRERETETERERQTDRRTEKEKEGGKGGEIYRRTGRYMERDGEKGGEIWSGINMEGWMGLREKETGDREMEEGG